MGITGILSIAKTALFTQQMAIEVTSHNVANVNTPGYSRQKLVVESDNPTPVSIGQIGTGVKGKEIIQYYDQFMNMKVNQKTSDMAGSEARQSSIKVLETLFNETNEDGVSKLLNQFWAAWNDLANNPAGGAERSTLVEQSTLLADQFNGMYSDIGRLESDMDLNLNTGVNDINSLTTRIADLNQQIVSVGEGGKAANDLRDKREDLVSQLAGLVDINYFEGSDGSVSIMTSRGNSLVMSNDHWNLELSGGHVNWINSSGAKTRLTSSEITGGKLGGWLDIKENVVPDVQSKMDSLANSLIREVNSQHSLGIGLSPFTSVTGSYSAMDSSQAISSNASGLSFHNTVTPGTFKVWLYDATGSVIGGAATTITVTAATTLDNVATAINAISGISASVNSKGQMAISVDSLEEPTAAGFAFSDDTSHALATLGVNTFFDGDGSGSIAVNSTISSDKGKIATAKVDGATGDYSHGDNENALALASLQHTDVDINGESTTFGSYYNALVGDVGIKAKGYNRDYEFTKNVVNQLSQARDSISGVSLDEEMATLIKYQHAYEAAAKLVQTSDEMLQTLLSLKQ